MSRHERWWTGLWADTADNRTARTRLVILAVVAAVAVLVVIGPPLADAVMAWRWPWRP